MGSIPASGAALSGETRSPRHPEIKNCFAMKWQLIGKYQVKECFQREYITCGTLILGFVVNQFRSKLLKIGTMTGLSDAVTFASVRMPVTVPM